MILFLKMAFKNLMIRTCIHILIFSFLIVASSHLSLDRKYPPKVSSYFSNSKNGNKHILNDTVLTHPAYCHSDLFYLRDYYEKSSPTQCVYPLRLGDLPTISTR